MSNRDSMDEEMCTKNTEYGKKLNHLDIKKVILFFILEELIFYHYQLYLSCILANKSKSIHKAEEPNSSHL